MEDGIARSPGFCMTMGTASTMASLAEALGMTLPGASSHPRARFQSRAHGHGLRRAHRRRWSGRILSRARSLTHGGVRERHHGRHGDRRLDQRHHPSGGAGRHAAGIKLDLPKFDEISQRTPMLANIRPSGAFLMEDFYYAGGLRALMAEIQDLLHLDCLTVNGKTLGENLDGAKLIKDDVIRTRANPVAASGGTVILYGNLAPDGAVIKTARRPIPRLLQHTGPAVVFKDYADMEARMDCDDLEVDGEFGPGAAERRTSGRAGDARVGHAADPEEAAAARGARHGADFRCAHERDVVWNLRAACVAGELCRRAAGAGAGRGFDLRWMSRTESWSCWCQTRSWRSAARVGLLLRRCMGADIWRCMPSG